MSVKNFLLNSDYPLDKVVWNKQDLIVVPADTDDSFTPGITIPHGLPFTPLPVLTWSNSSDFSTSYNDWEETYADSAVNGAMPAIGQQYTISADATNIYITRYNWGVGLKGLYYRIYCLMPSNASADSLVPYTQTQGANFVLNTDMNYMKLVNAGIFIYNGVASYNHNLGFVPRVFFWMEANGLIGYFITTQVISSDPTGSGGLTTGLRVSSSSLEWVNPSGYEKLHYRIYGDE